ncbi:DNA methyltransferase [Lactobacillus delbrueckii]|uniref:DNA methyltransferase n=2 Tax=Lactobacillus delbrueckii TaxID=1584 RepID=UPI001F3F60F6|nr:DNA methyltransferase [Lactobacillus delbrueckii]GHN24466.1 methylase [Lactobacillus delbrueckii]
MDVTQQKKQAKEFVKNWTNRGDERQDSQSFWLDLLEHVLGVKNPEQFIHFEKRVKLDNTSFIDGYIDQTKVMIEQKSSTKDLDKGIKQSDGSFLTPYQQAKRYSANLPYSQRPRWIVTSNFKEFRVYDMEHPNSEPQVIKLEDLGKEYYRLEFLVDKGNEHLEKEQRVSLAAGELVGKIYSELLKQYKDPDSKHTQESINQLSVRIVFCLYAEDAGIFGHKNMFHDYLQDFDAKSMRRALIDLFKVLDTKEEDRDPYLADDNPKLAKFPYVNGGMFSDENIEIPPFTDELRNLILRNASDGFDWSEISPTIFGAVFESTLNPDTRRQGGMHYTSIENIHKVIDPLFLDDLKEQLNQIKQLRTENALKRRAKEFQEKLASLKFLDPACGSGNFLTETYLSLRKLENEAIKLQITDNNVLLDTDQKLVKVSIQQFYGIEINDFAVSVAKTALWIAESQMLEETKSIVYANWDFLPLKTYTHIHEGNALRMDWNDVLPSNECNYIMGNPPFIGKKEQTKEQKQELKEVFNNSKVGNLDYVSGWYKKADNYVGLYDIKIGFVSTNSISQGEQVSLLWNNIANLKIYFAVRSFVWDSEAAQKAHVHVVVIGMYNKKIPVSKKTIFDGNLTIVSNNINPYLVTYIPDDVYCKSRAKNIDNNAPKMIYGSMPIDGGNLILDEDDVNEIAKEDQRYLKFVREYCGGNELINNKKRWCLWLEGANPTEYRNSRFITSRINLTRKFREKSGRLQTKKLADVPYLFGEIRQPKTTTLVFPKVSSEKRRYIPIPFVKSEVIINGSSLMIPDATNYEFGILESNMHMSWMRMVAGRMKSDYQYSKELVYNNFPWPTPTEEQKKKIAETAQGILDARALYPNSSLADLYDELTMPVELRKAHQANDRAVMAAYGLPIKGTTESDAVAKLFDMYEKLVSTSK